MDCIKGIAFYPFAPKGAFRLKEVYHSLAIMKERAGIMKYMKNRWNKWSARPTGTWVMGCPLGIMGWIPVTVSRRLNC